MSQADRLARLRAMKQQQLADEAAACGTTRRMTQSVDPTPTPASTTPPVPVQPSTDPVPALPVNPLARLQAIKQQQLKQGQLASPHPPPDLPTTSTPQPRQPSLQSTQQPQSHPTTQSAPPYPRPSHINRPNAPPPGGGMQVLKSNTAISNIMKQIEEENASQDNHSTIPPPVLNPTAHVDTNQYAPTKTRTFTVRFQNLPAWVTFSQFDREVFKVAQSGLLKTLLDISSGTATCLLNNEFAARNVIQSFNGLVKFGSLEKLKVELFLHGQASSGFIDFDNVGESTLLFDHTSLPELDPMHMITLGRGNYVAFRGEELSTFFEREYNYNHFTLLPVERQRELIEGDELPPMCYDDIFPITEEDLRAKAAVEEKRANRSNRPRFSNNNNNKYLHVNDEDGGDGGSVNARGGNPNGGGNSYGAFNDRNRRDSGGFRGGGGSGRGRGGSFHQNRGNHSTNPSNTNSNNWNNRHNDHNNNNNNTAGYNNHHNNNWNNNNGWQ